jgi:hypothetical protein
MNSVEINERGLFQPQAGLKIAETLSQLDVQGIWKMLHK